MNINSIDPDKLVNAPRKAKGEPASTITGKELADNARNGAIKAIRASKTRSGGNMGWAVVIQLTWKEGDVLLITQRKTPRYWKSFDRLHAHLLKLGLPITKIETVTWFKAAVLTRSDTLFFLN